tara:strand:- start:18328 stop:18471 length:144 start_codon:yes stop_codon:yes gene_type:complete
MCAKIRLESTKFQTPNYNEIIKRQNSNKSEGAALEFGIKKNYLSAFG